MDLHRPVLRPGARLVRRYDGRWQLHGAEAIPVVLDDAPGMTALAAALTHPWCPLPPDCEEVLDRLAEALVEADSLSGTLADPAQAGARAALVSRLGAAAEEAWIGRAETRVRVSGPAPWSGQAQALLTAAGVGLDAQRPEVRLLVHVGEPGPRLVEQVAREQVAHVWAGSVAGRTTVGPFVDPGRTACRDCVAAHLDDRQPGWAITRRQLAAPIGVPEPVEPATMSMAVSWAVADVLRWVDGEQPSTWSSTVDLGHELDPVPQRWRRHPRCGCSWSAAWLGRPG